MPGKKIKKKVSQKRFLYKIRPEGDCSATRYLPRN